MYSTIFPIIEFAFHFSLSLVQMQCVWYKSTCYAFSRIHTETEIQIQGKYERNQQQTDIVGKMH